MAILLFFLVLFVLILVHEWGHFIVAKKTGMRVDEFGIGFPPKLFGKKWHGTEYTFNALPIGGFVRIAGEDGADAPSSPVSSEARDGQSERSEAGQGGSNSQLAQNSVVTTDSIPPDSFVAKSKWAQAAVLIAGVTMNVLFAWVLFVAVFSIGLPTAVSESDASDAAVLTITQVLENGPASDASLPIGAVITKVSTLSNSLEQPTPNTFQEFTSSSQGQTLTLTYTFGGETKESEITPVTGIVIDDPERAAIGIALSLVETVRLPVYYAVVEATKTTVRSIGAITVGLSSLIVESVQGTADFSQVAGPIGIVGLVGDAAEFGITSLLMFTAVISLNLAVINMLPFPALDGGRLVMVGIEAVTRKPINPKWVGRVNLVGFALLMLLMLAVTYSDVTKLF